jgi:GT2 family glycosyltransferase
MDDIEYKAGALLRQILDGTHRIEESTSIDAGSQIDIIVPVHNGYEETAECVRRLYKNTDVPARLIIINDASTDERVWPLLSRLSERESCDTGIRELLVMRNPANLGFTRTVNKGLEQSNGDVVLMNSDAYVPPGWAGRLMARIIKDRGRVASVTPFSNRASICSFPLHNRDRYSFGSLERDRLDGFFRRFSPEVKVELPTGVGFCMAMNRRAIQEVGLLDEESFPRGYGEENDWCQRAVQRGFVNLMAANLYVEHGPGPSFSQSEREKLQRDGGARLRIKHPFYFNRVADFLGEDPLRPVRETMASLIDANLKPAGVRSFLVLGVSASIEDALLSAQSSGSYSPQIRVLVLGRAADEEPVLIYSGLALQAEFKWDRPLPNEMIEALRSVFQVDVVISSAGLVDSY